MRLLEACSRCAALIVLFVAVNACVPLVVRAQVAAVTPVVETDPVPGSGDAADDPAIWLHPTSPGSSRVIATDKQSGLLVYAFDGQELQFLPVGEVNNVAVRYGLLLGGVPTDVAVASHRTDAALVVWSIDPASGLLTDVTADGGIVTGIVPYGLCLYKSPVTAKYYAFANSKGGRVEQWELADDGAGAVTGSMVRTFDVGTQTEGCVADDPAALFYIGEEDVGIWRYGAEPGDGEARTLVDHTGAGGNLAADVEGLAIYRGGQDGYLLASSQGDSTFVVYERAPPNAYVGTFEVVAGPLIDQVGSTDGIDVTSVPLGPLFPEGVFIAQDGTNPGGTQNFKLVPWTTIADAFDPPLLVDTSWDPRGAAPACDDGLDNDGDGLVDSGTDAGCNDAGDSSETADCDDGLDNDADGMTDHAEDPGCARPGARREDPACDDGLDNDGDGLVDAADPHCTVPSGDSEEATVGGGLSCGLGPELPLALGLLGWLRRRAPRASRPGPRDRGGPFRGAA